MEETDIASMKKGGEYRARLLGTITRTYAAAMDVEHFDLLLATACGQKNTVIEKEL